MEPEPLLDRWTGGRCAFGLPEPGAQGDEKVEALLLAHLADDDA
jgi:hypothetical protein